jgi:hypothetical protein
MAPVPPSALWSQVATRAGGTEDEVQRAVLRAAGFEWCARAASCLPLPFGVLNEGPNADD